MRKTLTAALFAVLFVTGLACDKGSPTEPPPPTPTPAPTPTPTPIPLVAAGLFGTTELLGSHGESQGPAPGITITITQGVVTLTVVSGSDGSYVFPVGGGLGGPANCKVFSTAPSGYQGLNGLNAFLTPGLNGPFRVGLVGVGPP